MLKMTLSLKKLTDFVLQYYLKLFDAKFNKQTSLFDYAEDYNLGRWMIYTVR
jgi:hypothetical protein